MYTHTRTHTAHKHIRCDYNEEDKNTIFRRGNVTYGKYNNDASAEATGPHMSGKPHTHNIDDNNNNSQCSLVINLAGSN